MTTSRPPLELIVSDDIRDLFSDYLEGTLDEANVRRVDSALENDSALRQDLAAFKQTMALLKALPEHDAPNNLVSNVRNRLANERKSTSNVVPLAWFQRPAFIGFAAAAAVVAAVVIVVPEGDSAKDMLGASLLEDAVQVSWQAPGLDETAIDEAAAASGMGRQHDGSFVGDQRSAARFFIALKTRAATAGVDVSGAVPERAERVVVKVSR